MKFKAGQRWVSQTEPKLGLGHLVENRHRRIVLNFSAAGEQRTYAADSAPLSRVRFRPGDVVLLESGVRVVILQAMEQNDLMFYSAAIGADAASAGGQQGEEIFAETELSSTIQLSSPLQRLETGLLDRLSAWRLRVQALHHQAYWQQSGIQGLLGCRTWLLPHQLYIAHEVGRHPAPRVLLADEVGLGKTIEAGMILNYQLARGLASRVLLVVPEPLVNQWMIEMLRRFNLTFTILDAQVAEELRNEGHGNPFESAQRLLCAAEWLHAEPQRVSEAEAAGWDVIVVDEAHHLHWHPEGGDTAWQNIARLAAISRGVLLLTATPEQLGEASHFGRLHLLDPARFPDYAAFTREHERYLDLAPLAEALSAAPPGQPLNPVLAEALQTWLPAREIAEAEADLLMRRLIDRYGTGRVMFRNTRSTVNGFVARSCHPVPLDLPACYAEMQGLDQLHPEGQIENDSWLLEDPRVTWLVELGRRLRPEKILVLCARRDTARVLSRYLHLSEGLKTTAFHEGMALLERDRAAAWFADAEEGAQIMVCSEIGSEGRNFQFAHHLVLFDLPIQPDLLEQRIGRLDRLGQRYPVEVYCPWFRNTAQERLFRWHHEALGAIEESFSGGRHVYEAIQDELQTLLCGDEQTAEAVLDRSRQLTREVRERLEAGRDRLLELHSCNPAVADTLIERILQTERPQVLRGFLEDLCDHYGILYEEIQPHTLVLRPGEAMHGADFPGLSEDGTPVTFNRDRAMRREDLQFLTWEHPLLTNAMETLLSSVDGNATVVTLPLPGVKPTTLLLEAICVFSMVAPAYLGIERYTDLQPLRILIDSSGRDLAALVNQELVDERCVPVKNHLAVKLIGQVREQISELGRLLEVEAERRSGLFRTDALNRLVEEEQEESLRRTGLAANASAAPPSAEAITGHTDTGSADFQARRVAIEGGGFEIQALRLIVTMDR